jgi:hypothetical protein
VGVCWPAAYVRVRAARPAARGPHAFIGATWDTPGSDVPAVTEFIRQSRAGRDFPAWTTFNTWFVHGVYIDEELARREMDVAAQIGIELYQLDAYAHTSGLYEILAAVRARYPDMTIENCSGGGNRLDFALARLTDSAWMDDRSAPSAHVRRNLNALLQMLPAPYLFSYVMGDADEPMRDAIDMPMLVRSRMPGVVGVATDFWQLGERESNGSINSSS